MFSRIASDGLFSDGLASGGFGEQAGEAPDEAEMEGSPIDLETWGLSAGSRGRPLPARRGAGGRSEERREPQKGAQAVAPAGARGLGPAGQGPGPGAPMAQSQDALRRSPERDVGPTDPAFVDHQPPPIEAERERRGAPSTGRRRRGPLLFRVHRDDHDGPPHAAKGARARPLLEVRDDAAPDLPGERICVGARPQIHARGRKDAPLDHRTPTRRHPVTRRLRSPLPSLAQFHFPNSRRKPHRASTEASDTAL